MPARMGTFRWLTLSMNIGEEVDVIDGLGLDELGAGSTLLLQLHDLELERLAPGAHHRAGGRSPGLPSSSAPIIS